MVVVAKEGIVYFSLEENFSFGSFVTVQSFFSPLVYNKTLDHWSLGK